MYPKQKTFLAQWLQGLEENAKVKMLRNELGDSYQTVQDLKKIKQLQGAQARMPFEFQWK